MSYVRQREPLGLGHAILFARALVGDEPFAVFLGDDIIKGAATPCMRQLLDVSDRYQAPAIAVERVPSQRIHQYGVIKARPVENRVHQVLDLVEKPKPWTRLPTWPSSAGTSYHPRSSAGHVRPYYPFE